MSGKFSLKDRHGNDLYFANYGDYWGNAAYFIPDSREQRTNVRHMELRDGDVILASFPRSGTSWHHQIIQMLLQNTTEYVGKFFTDHLEIRPLDGMSRPEGPWVYSTHIPRFHLLPEQVTERKVKVIYPYRNPKDCWVSFYNLASSFKRMPYEGTWAHFFDLMMDCGYWYGDWFDHVLDYEKAATDHPDQVFLSCYEMMKKDPVEQILKMSQFLGFNRSRQLCEGIAEACHFSKLKAAKEAQSPGMVSEVFWKPGVPGVYRKGEVGDWKNWFTPDQNERLDAVFGKRMAQSNIPFFFE